MNILSNTIRIINERDSLLARHRRHLGIIKPDGDFGKFRKERSREE
tara:strand:- start:645 stop:782 length:138 start_codon:yes stop_codon:yes gene_type:complete